MLFAPLGLADLKDLLANFYDNLIFQLSHYFHKSFRIGGIKSWLVVKLLQGFLLIALLLLAPGTYCSLSLFTGTEPFWPTCFQAVSHLFYGFQILPYFGLTGYHAAPLENRQPTKEGVGESLHEQKV